MSYVIQAVLSNAQHPEYGQVTISETGGGTSVRAGYGLISLLCMDQYGKPQQ